MPACIQRDTLTLPFDERAFFGGPAHGRGYRCFSTPPSTAITCPFTYPLAVDAR